MEKDSVVFILKVDEKNNKIVVDIVEDEDES